MPGDGLGEASLPSLRLKNQSDIIGRVNDLEALGVAGAAWELRLPAVSRDRLEHPSACAGWSIYDLVNHVNGGGHRYLLLMQGAAAEQLSGTRARDHVLPNPLESYQQWEQPLVAAFEMPNALSCVVHHPVGDRSGLDLLRMRTLDLALHSWDLAHSLDLDETLDPTLIGYLLEHCVSLVEELRGHGLYAEADQKHPEHPSRLQELLRQTGRS